MRPVLFFGAATWCTFLVACVVSVYGFDQYSHAAGRSGALQLEAWLSLLGALVATGAFGIAAALMSRTHTPRAALALGIGSSAALSASCWILSANQVSGTAYFAFALLVALPCLAAYMGEAIGS